MPFTGKVGDTLFLGDTGGRHRYVILTEPNNDGNVVITNFTTASHFEWNVVFRPKDNKQLFTERCTPNYHDARFYPFSGLLKIAQSTHAVYAFCARHHIKKIVTGALQSNHTPLEILRELAAQYPKLISKWYTTRISLNFTKGGYTLDGMLQRVATLLGKSKRTIYKAIQSW